MPHLIAIAKAYPISTAQHFNAKLTLMHKNLKRGLSRGALDPESKTWPGIPELSLLRIIGQIWPTSDLNHAVVSPTRILMGAYLGLGRIRSLSDMASGMFLCTLFLQFEMLSKRVVPETINFLVNTVLHLGPHRYEDVTFLPGSFPSPDFRSEHCRPLAMSAKARKTLSSQRPDFAGLMQAEDSDEQAKADLVALALDLLDKYADLYKGVEGFIELYEPVLEVLQNVETKRLFEGHKVRYSRKILSIFSSHLNSFIRLPSQNSSTLSSGFSNSRGKRGVLFFYKHTNRSRSRRTSPNSRRRARTTCVARILTTRRTRRRSCAISISKRGRVPSVNFARTRVSLPVSSRRSRLRRIVHITSACAESSARLKASVQRRKRRRERRLKRRDALAGSEKVATHV